ncbi:MAG: hypothetical protein ACOZQL_06230 [Myxococcota bacterium]
MRPFAWPVLLVLTACQPQESNVLGSLVLVTVERGLNDDCSPRRFAGDAGVQFFAVQEDGGALFTLSRHAKYGPTIDGGVLEGVEPQIENGPASLPDYACSGSYSEWVRVAGSATVKFDLRQAWIGADSCPEGPWWLPTQQCNTERRFTFTELRPCESRCVKYQLNGEVTCDC